MQISENIILDLLPLYHSRQASRETVKLVEDYFEQHREFASEHQIKVPLLKSKDTSVDELNILKRTKFYLRMRALLFGLALFTTCLPFAFGSVSWDNYDGVRWLWTETPEIAVLSGISGVVCWILYGILRSRLKVTAL